MFELQREGQISFHWAWSQDPFAPDLEYLLDAFLRGNAGFQDTLVELNFYKQSFRHFAHSQLIAAGESADAAASQQLHGIYRCVLDDLDFAERALKSLRSIALSERVATFENLVKRRNRDTFQRLAITSPVVSP